jgi:hypothetical protein
VVPQLAPRVETRILKVSPEKATPNKIIQTTGKTKATDSGKKRQAVEEEDEVNKGKEDSEEKKTDSVKKPKLTLGKGEAEGRNRNE